MRDIQRTQCFSTRETDKAIPIIYFTTYFASAEHKLITASKLIFQKNIMCLRDKHLAF